MKTSRETQQDAYWGGIPSLSHHWMAAMLRLVAMGLVSLAGFFGMRVSRLARECHTEATPQALPLRKSDPITKETELAAASSQETMPALMPQGRATTSKAGRALYAHPLKHEGVPAAASDKPVETYQDRLDLPPLIPANAGTRAALKACSKLRLQPQSGASVLFRPGFRSSPE